MNEKEIEILSHIKIFGGKILQLGDYYGVFITKFRFFIPPKSLRFYIQVSISSQKNRKVF
jgi:hypothetical protein